MTESFTDVVHSPAQDFVAAGLRSDTLEIVVLPESGAKVYSLKNLHSGREWMWTPPEGATIQKMPLGTPFEESSLIGADECLPTIFECEWRGRSIPSHGEAWSSVWELDRLALTQGRIVTRLQLPISPFWVERTIRVEGNKIVVEYALRNTDFAPQEFMWAFHPLMKIEAGDHLEFPGITHMLAESSIGVPLGERGDRIAWPYPMEGVSLDQLDFGRPDAAVKLFTEAGAASSATIRNERTGDALRFDFDPQRVDTVGVWLTRGGWNGYHHLAVEPGIGAPDPLDVAVEGWKRFALVKPDQTYRWQFTITLAPV
jgi:galactose mutarotase-like enzyme